MQRREQYTVLSDFLQRHLEEFVERVRQTLFLVSGEGVRVPHVVQFLIRVNMPRNEEERNSIRENDGTDRIERISGRVENEIEPEGDDGESLDRRLIAWMTPPI